MKKHNNSVKGKQTFLMKGKSKIQVNNIIMYSLTLSCENKIKVKKLLSIDFHSIL